MLAYASHFFRKRCSPEIVVVEDCDNLPDISVDPKLLSSNIEDITTAILLGIEKAAKLGAKWQDPPHVSLEDANLVIEF